MKVCLEFGVTNRDCRLGTDRHRRVLELDGRDAAKMKNKIMLVGKMSRVFALLR